MNNQSMEIRIEKNPTQQRLKELGISHWPIWEKEVSKFDWHYPEEETCYLLEGEAIISSANNKPIRIVQGDLVVFPKGLSCQWEIVKKVKKHYKIG
ncbi:cupin domain-containing protein [Methylacidiphilum kamchatkense]|uniref:(S)-ureidoglycine aminohydrolase cupin domain-containing protein n=2 Tax=Methylacidiphilum kamchatkense Kam1 TaxID=1202785 RepID=A0A516TND8_9BACT|nr:cupin domain-containing protein [Methylacidiphilum kamchatkense]QDQ42760.1 hypothetical protein kam1_1542 [Methylacidiphilum kamchatkense Kam1]